jgi:hypothetical protein
MCVLPRSCSGTNYDRTPPKKAGVCLPRSYRGILNEVRMHKHTHISIQYHDIQVIKLLLYIKCHVLEFIKDESQKML